jgi:lysophospholipase L1-like esterase
MVASPTITKPKTEIAPKQPASKPKWKTIVSFVAWQMVAILFVELVLFTIGLGEEEIFKFDPEIGFRHMTNKRITWRTEGFAQSYLNEDGMREPGLTVSKPANTYRIALLGDSMVEGYQVPIEQTFGEQIAKQLGSIDGKNIQFLNFGTSGYSTAQEYLQLKRQVLKYQPDLVLLCYNSRDLFENWTAPDQVITNVRPAAIHLPGGSLNIDNTQVRRWFNTPRAKFLRSIDWIREHSRIYGLFAAIDLEWSQKNPYYRAFINTIAKPKNGPAEFQKAFAAAEKNSGPAWNINFFEDTKRAAKKPEATPAKTASEETKNVFISAASNDTLSAAPELPKAVMPDTPYAKIVSTTLSSIVAEMKGECEKNGAKFAIVSLPVRAQLCPLIGMETAFGTIDYPQELDAVSKICAAQNIPYFDVEAAAEKLPPAKRESLFYVVHLAPQGHEFIANQIAPFVKAQFVNEQPLR